MTAHLQDRPADFDKVVAHMTLRELRAHYHVGSAKIMRWKAGEDAKQVGGAKAMKRPDDFEQHKHMLIGDLCRKYGRSKEVIRRWLLEVGEVRTQSRPQRPNGITMPPTRNPLIVGNPLLYRRDVSQAGQAAEYLQQFGGVWRCTKTGKPDPNGQFWRRGNSVLTDAEIIERAEWMRSRRMAA